MLKMPWLREKSNEKNFCGVKSNKYFDLWFEFPKLPQWTKGNLGEHFSASACSFLSLGLRPRPQKCGLGFEKLSLGSLLSTSVTWEKLKSEVKTVSYRRVIEKNRTKYYSLCFGSKFCSILWKSHMFLSKNRWPKTIWRNSNTRSENTSISRISYVGYQLEFWFWFETHHTPYKEARFWWNWYQPKNV